MVRRLQRICFLVSLLCCLPARASGEAMEAIRLMKTDPDHAFAVLEPILLPSSGTTNTPAWAVLGMLAAQHHTTAERLVRLARNTPHGRVASTMRALSRASTARHVESFSEHLDAADQHLSQLDGSRCDLAWVLRKAVAYGRVYVVRHNLPAARQRLLWTAAAGVYVLDRGKSDDFCQDVLAQLSVMRLATAGYFGSHGLLDASYSDLSLMFGGTPGDVTDVAMAELVRNSHLDRLRPAYAAAERAATRHRHEGRLKEAAIVYLGAMKLSPRSAWERSIVPCGLAEVFEQLGRTADAVVHYRHCAEQGDVSAATSARIALMRLDAPTRVQQFSALVAGAHLGMSAPQRLLVRTTWLANADDVQIRSEESLRAIRNLPAILDQLFEDFGGSTWFTGPSLMELRRHLHRGAHVLYEAGDESTSFQLLHSVTARSVWTRRHRRDLAKDGDPIIRDALAEIQTHVPLEALDELLTGHHASLNDALLQHAQLERRATLLMTPLPSLPSLAEVQQRLGPREVRVSYHRTGSELLIGVTMTDRFRLARVELGEDSSYEDAAILEDLATSAGRHGIRPISGTRRRLHDLYKTLFAPIASWIPANAVIWIAPDGALHGVPFDALLTAPLGDDVPWSEGDFLGDAHLIGLLPSGSWLTATHPRSNAMPSVLLLGVEEGAGGPPLPGVRTELVAVAAQWPGAGSAVWCDGCQRQPTVGTFLEEAGQFDLLHIATHASSHGHPALRPLGVSLAHLWLRDARGREARLWEHHIQTMITDAELVFLNACQTIAGDASELEGAMGLSTAFLIAGADTVVSTRWAVRDELASTFATEFYRAYSEQRQKAPALRTPYWKLSAMRHARDAIRATGRDAPHDWAAHVLSGLAE